MFNENENNKLNNLVSINKDASSFYQSAREKVENPQLNSTFQSLEDLHSAVVIDLQNYIRENGGEPENDQTMTGQVSEMWGNLMANMSSDVDETLVSHLEEAEDRCLHSIQDAMQDEDIRPETKTVLTSELNALRKSHDHMKALKDTMKAA